jgi:hypothetical protein
MFLPRPCRSPQPPSRAWIPSRRGTVLTGLSFIAAVAASCGPRPVADMNPIAERYVRLVLKVGQQDADYVDAYYGDERLRPTGGPEPLTALARDAASIRADLARLVLPDNADELTRLRREYLDRQLSSIEARVAMLNGERLSFDEESRRLYDAEAPRHTEAEFQTVIDRLNRLLPGSGPLVDRYTGFRNRFVIPSDRVDAVFRAAIDGCRARTAAHLALPPGEAFTVEYVKGKSWSAYNWYQGNYRSLIQVNVELPISIDRAIDLACHEGYPGHHVYNALIEQHLVRDRGWVEFTVYALFSPQSLVAEGTANLGIEVAFPDDERTAFEQEVLYPLAGLDPSKAAAYAAVRKEIEALTYVGNEAARRYLNGETDRAEAAAWLETWALMPRERAEQRIKFFDQYRSYVINYNLGRDLVRAYVERRGGTPDRPDVRWREFAALLSSPRLPSGLR